MRIGTNPNATWLTVGAILAVIVLVVDVVFMAIGNVDLKIGLMIAGLAVARLV